MKVRIFNERIHISQDLPDKISGMYPLYIGGEIFVNIIAEGDNWLVQLSSMFSSQDLYYEKPRLEPYKIYIVTSKITGERFFLIATPKYNPNYRSYDIPARVTVGSNADCDIYYALDFSKDEYLQIEQNAYGWVAHTNSPHFFISGERLQTGQVIHSGDYIYFFGLKLIFIQSRVIIDNPNNKATIKENTLQLNTPDDLRPQLEESVSITIKDDLPLYTEADYFYKSPRFNYLIETADVEIDMPPDREKPNEMPAILTVGPQITMASASMLSMSVMIVSATSGTINRPTIWISVSAMAVTMIGTILWPVLTRKFNSKRLKRKEEKRQKKYTAYLLQKHNLINFIKANQYETLLENNPSPEICAQIIQNRSKLLWQRSVSHEDFLSIRLGTGKVKTKLNITEPKEQFSTEDDDNLQLSTKRIINDARYIEDAPFTYNLTKHSVNAIVGDIDSIQHFMDCLFLQIATFHSYTDLKIVVFTSEPNKWEYLKILPHCWDASKETRYFATSLDMFSTITSELEKTFNARVNNDEEVRLEDDGDNHKVNVTFKDFQPYYLFFIDNMSTVRNVPLIKKILHYKRNLGFSILTITGNVSNLPNETSSFICISPQNSIIATDDDQEPFNADFNNDRLNISFCTQQLANIPVPAGKSKFELPPSLSFLELYKLGRIEQFNSLSRWKQNNPSTSLSVPVGIDQNNEIFNMDIHEKAYGPHGLIAGTTGSGKSEWIITYILSLAVNFSPDEVQFVLIDYKGGGLAKSFENADLGIKLPHLAGTITNLDKSEIFRSISAIESELKRRQSIFNSTREKLREGSMDIYKYQQCYRKGLVDEPLSHLLIICDEFAELKQQEPDFMAQLISTARVGRSLGVHLILATQKPSGVVNDQIWSNSKFKVCLKVQSKSDSNEIIRRPDAAFLKQTGAFYIQVGNDDYFNLGQSAWAGAKYFPSDSASHKIDASVQCINDIGQVIESSTETKEAKEDQGEELLNIVSYLSKTSEQIDIKSKPMWLKNIEPNIILSDVKKRYQLTPSGSYNYDTLIGEYDEPRRQQQGPLKLDLSAGNIAIVGRADGSIERLISTIIWSSICEHTPNELAYYILDFGTETMKKFAKFPQVGEVVFQDELDKVAGVVSLITDEIDRRKEMLSEYNGSFEYYNQANQEDKLHLIVVVINNFDIFGEALPRALGLITELFRDAPKYGITFIISSNATNVISQRILQFFNHFILMQLSDDVNYRNLTGCRRGLIPKKVVGRGICKIDSNDNDSYCEFQTAMIASPEEEPQIIKDYANECVEYYKTKVKQLTKIPEDTSSDDLSKLVSDLANVPIGTNLYEKDVAKYDFLNQKLHLITGPSIAENMNFIYGLSTILSKVPNIKVRVVDLLGLFKKPILDIKIFDEDINLVFGALEKDVLTRTEAQDYGITLIIGAGQYKNKLSKGGVEIYNNLFDNLGKSKKCIYLLIDDYEQLRNLKREDWFKTVDTTKGIWLGQGLNNQSLFDCEKINNEDQKLNYAGLAFTINDKKYQVIKTLMDNDA